MPPSAIAMSLRSSAAVTSIARRPISQTMKVAPREAQAAISSSKVATPFLPKAVSTAAPSAPSAAGSEAQDGRPSSSNAPKARTASMVKKRVT
jgi:hypothetical protein